MNRTGLLVALAIAVMVGLLFGVNPDLDLVLSRPFAEVLHGPDPFGLSFDPAMLTLRRFGTLIVIALVVPAAFALALKFVLPRSRLLFPGRMVIFLVSTFVLGPGLLVNATLKDHWGRSRPIDVVQLGGQETFVAWWDLRGDCPRNCSFVSGEVSAAIWTLSPAALAPPAWRAVAYGGALALGAGITVLRMAAGAHFLTDAVFAGVLTFLVIWIVHGVMYRWPGWRLSDDAIERAIERTALPPHELLLGLFRKRRPAPMPE